MISSPSLHLIDHCIFNFKHARILCGHAYEQVSQQFNLHHEALVHGTAGAKSACLLVNPARVIAKHLVGADVGVDEDGAAFHHCGDVFLLCDASAFREQLYAVRRLWRAAEGLRRRQLPVLVGTAHQKPSLLWSSASAMFCCTLGKRCVYL